MISVSKRAIRRQEDASLVRRGNAPQVQAAPINSVIGVVRQHGERNLAAVQRVFMRRFAQAINRLGLG